MDASWCIIWYAEAIKNALLGALQTQVAHNGCRMRGVQSFTCDDHDAAKKTQLAVGYNNVKLN